MVGFIEAMRCVLCCLEHDEEEERERFLNYHDRRIPTFTPPPVVPQYQRIPHFTPPQPSPPILLNNNSRGSSSGNSVSSSAYLTKQKPTPGPLAAHTQTSLRPQNSTPIRPQSDITPLLKPSPQPNKPPPQQQQVSKASYSSLPGNTANYYNKTREISPLPAPSYSVSSSVTLQPSFKPPHQSKKQPPPQQEVPKTSYSIIPVNNITNNNKSREITRLASPSSSTTLPPSFKPPPLLSSLSKHSSSSSLVNEAVKKSEYVYSSHKEAAAPLYSVPEDFRELIKKDIVPQLLRKPVAPSTYSNYFAALLYAEDAYIEKWSSYCLRNVTLEQQKATLYTKSSKNKNLIVNEEEDEKMFVAFRIDSIPERRPFLLSRDFVLLQPLDKAAEKFRGILYRVVKSNLVLAEFGDDFHHQHSSNQKYDVSFSFNRVCLKRCHQAVAAATDPSFQNFLFPEQKPRTSLLDPPRVIPSQRNLNQKQSSAVYNISRLKGSPPFLIEGPLSVISSRSRRSVGEEKKLSATGLVIQEAVLQIYKTAPGCRILISAPTNNTCDVLMRNLRKEIPASEIFRANAAFRELDGVPIDILPACPFKNECFTCPPLNELRRYKVVLSTFVSSFRLHNEGINMGHFSHIFLVDSCLTTEPETMVALANLADEGTVVVASGAIGSCSGWVRSNIARGFGLKISYFQRLLESRPYCNLDPMFVACIRDNGDPELDRINQLVC